MKKKREGSISLKWGVFTAVVLCWVVPVLIIVSVAGFLLNQNYEEQLRQSVEDGTSYAMEQVELRLQSALESSKAVSYDGDIRDAYRTYEENRGQVQLYRAVTDYLSQSYSRDENFKAVFITFLDQPDSDYAYVVSKATNSYNLLQDYRREARSGIMEIAYGMDTGIRFEQIGGELYIVRNLMDARFQPYAVLVMQCDNEVLFQSLESIANLDASEITLDDAVIDWNMPDPRKLGRDDRVVLADYTSQVGGHSLQLRARIVEKNLWGAMPGLRWAICLILLLVFPVIFVVVFLFYIHVTHPVEVLVNASNQVQEGQRGYQITELPHSQEFQKLTRHFNSMSTELKSQFERLYLEQQALQESRIKALQSQINPHFLGNTLEIINWEARLAENDKVSAMIEALSTMLDAAIGRDGRAQITLKEELTYVDAYLYIIQQRLGDGLTITKDIDESLLEQPVPRLVLQPLVENAVDHDLSMRRGSELCIRVYARSQILCLEVEHEGLLTPADQANIQRLLSAPADSAPQRKVGIRNLNQRLKLIYGDRGSLQIETVSEGRILACIQLPLSPAAPAGPATEGTR